MAEKILNIDDYRKKTENNDTEIDIQIEDPFNFLSPSERDEYLKAQNKAKEEAEMAAKAAEEAAKTETSDQTQEEVVNTPVQDNKEYRREYDDYDEEDDDYDDEDEYEEERERRHRRSISPEKIVRIASIITGILILILIAAILKANVFDKFFGTKDAETQTVSVSLPGGYTETNDTVVATADVNLRSVPSTASSDYIVTAVVKGTELTRLGVSDDGYWAYVEYNGQQLYCSMKYLEVKQ